jgi:hypothetical protein
VVLNDGNNGSDPGVTSSIVSGTQILAATYGSSENDSSIIGSGSTAGSSVAGLNSTGDAGGARTVSIYAPPAEQVLSEHETSCINNYATVRDHSMREHSFCCNLTNCLDQQHSLIISFGYSFISSFPGGARTRTGGGRRGAKSGRRKGKEGSRTQTENETEHAALLWFHVAVVAGVV